jgi:hypothetical protein
MKINESGALHAARGDATVLSGNGRRGCSRLKPYEFGLSKQWNDKEEEKELLASAGLGSLTRTAHGSTEFLTVALG